MKPPSPLDYIIGNPISALIIVVATLFVVMAAIGGSATSFAAFTMLAICGWSWFANRRLQTYRLWKMEWDAMSGNPKPAKPARKTLGLPKVRLTSSKHQPEPDLVSVMVPLPKQSSTIMDAYNALPPYCERAIRGN